MLVRAVQTTTGVSDSTGAVGMLGGNGPEVGPRGGARPVSGTGLTTLQTAGQGGIGSLNTGVGVHGGNRYDPDKKCAPMGCSGSDADSDSGDDDDMMGSIRDNRRGVKRERLEMEAAVTGQGTEVPAGAYGLVPGGVAGAKPGKKTRGRVKIKMEFIDNKLRRYTTFSKRKTGIMKKVSNHSENSSCCISSHVTLRCDGTLSRLVCPLQNVTCSCIILHGLYTG